MRNGQPLNSSQINNVVIYCPKNYRRFFGAILSNRMGSMQKAFIIQVSIISISSYCIFRHHIMLYNRL